MCYLIPVIESLFANTIIRSFKTRFRPFIIEKTRYGYRPSDY